MINSTLPTPETVAVICKIVTDPAIRKRALWFGERYSTPLLAAKLEEIVTGVRPAMSPNSGESPVDWTGLAAGVRLAAKHQLVIYQCGSEVRSFLAVAAMPLFILLLILSTRESSMT